MLAASGDPAYAGHGDTSWTGGVYPSILDYMTLKRLCGWIPATLHITEVFQTLITAPATDDRFVSLLQVCWLVLVPGMIGVGRWRLKSLTISLSTDHTQPISHHSHGL